MFKKALLGIIKKQEIDIESLGLPDDKIRSQVAKVTLLPWEKANFFRFGFDENGEFLFLVYERPQVLVCLDREHRYVWSLCIGEQCCAGLPVRFCQKSFIVSGGCNGFVHRIDLHGKELGRIQPICGEGVAILSNEVVKYSKDKFAVSAIRGNAIIDCNFRHLFTDLK